MFAYLCSPAIDISCAFASVFVCLRLFSFFCSCVRVYIVFTLACVRVPVHVCAFFVSFSAASQNESKDCTTLHHTAPHCNTLQHTVTHCDTLSQHTVQRTLANESNDPYYAHVWGGGGREGRKESRTDRVASGMWNGGSGSEGWAEDGGGGYMSNMSSMNERGRGGGDNCGRGGEGGSYSGNAHSDNAQSDRSMSSLLNRAHARAMMVLCVCCCV